MKRAEFIEKLSKKLRDFNVEDMEEIVAEYEEHFALKLADGYSEEEIAARLGAPESLARQFAAGSGEKRPKGAKALALALLAFIGFNHRLFFGASVCRVRSAGRLCGGVGSRGALPAVRLQPIPASAAHALPVRGDIGGFRYIPGGFGGYGSGLLPAVLAAASESLRALPLQPACLRFRQGRAASGGFASRLGARLNRRLRSVALVSLTVFAISFAAGFSFAQYRRELWASGMRGSGLFK
jgi:hypothetical protein